MSPHLELSAELEQELEEARDTIERLLDEKAGITRQRDEMKRQLDKAITENLEKRETKGRVELPRLVDKWRKEASKYSEESKSWESEGDFDGADDVGDLADVCNRHASELAAAFGSEPQPPRGGESSAMSCSANLIAEKLDNLAHEMRSVGAELEGHGNKYCEYALARSEELLGAADMAREWAKNLRVSVKQNADVEGRPEPENQTTK